MSKESKVKIQRGPIESNPRTMKQMTNMERQFERAMELSMIRRNQSLDFVEPKSRRK